MCTRIWNYSLHTDPSELSLGISLKEPAGAIMLKCFFICITVKMLQVKKYSAHYTVGGGYYIHFQLSVKGRHI